MLRLLLILALGLLPPSALAGVVYFENFESGLNGWVSNNASLQASGGVSDSAYLQGSRFEFAPVFGAHGSLSTGPAADYLLGDLTALYGDQIQISYHARAFVGGDRNVGHIIYHSDGTSWFNDAIADITAFTQNWSLAEFTINTTWSDSEAAGAGWTRLSGGSSFADTLRNVNVNYGFYAWQTEGTDTYVGGIDDFTIQGVDGALPAPGGPWVWILILGLMLVSVRHTLRAVGSGSVVRSRSGAAG
ncbi:MAG: hypothetical protein ACPGUC_06750 [Gammaproteobacteria bacterium]